MLEELMQTFLELSNFIPKVDSLNKWKKVNINLKILVKAIRLQHLKLNKTGKPLLKMLTLK